MATGGTAHSSDSTAHSSESSAYGTEDIWTVFADAVLAVHVDGHDLVVGRDRLPWTAPTYAVTAWNPGEERPARENAAANARLEADLLAAGIEHHPATGSSPDGSWSEPGFLLVGCRRNEALAVARRYGQLAIYEVIEDLLVVVPCDA